MSDAQSTDELLKLLRFQRLDERNGTLSGEPDAIRLCGAAADAIERLERALTETHDAWTAETTKRLQAVHERGLRGGGCEAAERCP